MKRIASPESIDLFKRSVLLAINISDKYENSKAYEAALEGLYVGLNLYAENKREVELELYLAWYIKTSIEFRLGYDTEDTKIWKEKYLSTFSHTDIH